MTPAVELDDDDLEADQDKEQEIEVPFDPRKIDIKTGPITIDKLLSRLKNRELDLTPDFQRQANLWDNKRKSRLIESILLRIPLPSFYFSEDEEGNYAVVDGLQRLCTIFHFMNVAELNRAAKAKLAPLRLSDMQYLRELNDRSFSELDRPFQRRIEELELTANVIRAGTPSAVKFNVFARLNQGGLALNAQEIRNAIFPGEWRRWIREMAESEAFVKVTEGKIKRNRQQDTELVLRYVALARVGSPYRRPKGQNLDDFLNETVEEHLLGLDDAAWEVEKREFDRMLKRAYRIFGKYAFRKYYGLSTVRAPINRGLFEAELIALREQSKEDIPLLAERREKILKSIHEALEHDTAFSRALSYATGSSESAYVRIKGMREIFREALND
ncbi:DUF262 domain-containing protein [Paraburkholderia aspalathi]|uniref:GmrSD restriction endonucleases N-terminal domain-containing protein n=1 Tax=Paraburkholderia nemoris TaxID=2793076 RepID=A0ABM8QN07_9BURK|nr:MULTISPECIES: DUF262 domain-containing protein [Paraburkholderia]MBK3808940.1 DUF262 domain-containing protein [Paraburkholderia aspalathi]CAE6706005.1 hypothetical protein R69776_00869 [Paraburkholderia nemoris]